MLTTGRQLDRLKEGIHYTHNGNHYIVLPKSTAVYRVSDRFFDSSYNKEMDRQAEALSACGYICSCPPSYPEVDPYGMVLNIVHACNLACDYCSALGGYYGGPKEFIDQSMAQRAINYLAKRSSSSILTVRFFGGEPLMRFDIIRETVSYARRTFPERTFLFTITTNATLMTEEMARFFAKEQFHDVLVSVDGCKEDHDRHRKTVGGKGSWDRTVAGVRLLEKHRVKCTINCVVSSDSSKSLLEHEAYLKQLFPHARIAVGYEYGATRDCSNLLEEWFTSIYDKAKKLVEVKGTPINRLISAIITSPKEQILDCTFGTKHLVVTPRGDIYLCEDSMTAGKQDGFHLGTLDTPDAGLDFGMAMADKCKKCWAFNLCGKGCHMRKMMGHGPEDSYCATQFRFIESALEYISQRDLESLYNDFAPGLYQKNRFRRLMISRACPDISPLSLNPCYTCAATSP